MISDLLLVVIVSVFIGCSLRGGYPDMFSIRAWECGLQASLQKIKEIFQNPYFMRVAPKTTH
jgi:hypothetical protein